MTARITVFALCLAAIAFAGSHTGAQRGELPQPSPPLALATGQSVELAWSLPPQARVDTVVIYRSGRDGAGLAEVARISAAELRWRDGDVTLGQVYEYRLQTVRGAVTSAISEPTALTVGGSARVTFVGGSVDRALFEVTMFRRGRRVSAQFVHKPGDRIGDLAYVQDLDSVEDFRLGPTLLKLDIAVSDAKETVNETLVDAAGQPMHGLGGRGLELEFTYPGATHEIVIATIQDAQGRPRQLKAGEAFKTD
jgi:hypothetical protein